MRRPTIALLALLATIAAGCGATEQSPDLSGQEKAVADVITELEDAARESDARLVCRQILSVAVARRLGDRCEKTVEQAFDDADTTELETDSVRIRGTTARARVKTGANDHQTELVELVREGNAWRISRFGGPVEDATS